MNGVGPACQNIQLARFKIIDSQKEINEINRFPKDISDFCKKISGFLKEIHRRPKEMKGFLKDMNGFPKELRK